MYVFCLQCTSSIDLLRIIPHLSAHSNPELQADVAREFMKHLGFEQEDLGEGVTYTVQDICKKWYSQRECKDGAFDDLVAALLKTKSMGRLVSCIGLPTCKLSIIIIIVDIIVNNVMIFYMCPYFYYELIVLQLQHNNIGFE